MTIRAQMLRVLAQEDINFLLTNRIPRRLLTQFIGWFSRIEQPLVRDLSIGVWRLFSDLDLREAKDAQFRSMHDCFTRELKKGARPIDPRPDVLVSPCDAIVGACGTIAGTELYQAKGFPYTLEDLLCDRAISSSAPQWPLCHAATDLKHVSPLPRAARCVASDEVIYISGDTWNVNPIALKRVERLFCKNERAVMPMTLAASGRAGDLGRRCRNPGRQHSPKFSGCAAQSPASRAQLSSPATHRSAKAMNWGGSSTVRPSLSLPQALSRCATTCAKARCIRVGEPLMQMR